ncbi:MAG TPA: hypothetical protein VM692_10115, partial [Gammaproteobacteria bacterium]|nr:hypothetical protein [Gammaproteobacteria bacterium]
TWNLNAAISASGVAWVVFDAQVGTRAEELFLAKLDGEPGSLARLSADDGVRSKYPDLALEGERAAITWFDERDGNNEVYMAAGPVADLAQSIDKHARRITITPGASIGAYVAWNAGQIGLAWSEDSGDNYEVLFQPFDATASPLAAARWLTETRANSMIPAIKPCGDGFVLAWDEVTPGEGGDAHDPSTRAEILFAIVR